MARLWGGYGGGSGAAHTAVWCRVGGKGGPEARPFRATSWVGWVAETRETGKRQEPGHRLAPDPSEKSPVTIPPERAINRMLLSKGLEIDDLCSSLREMVP